MAWYEDLFGIAARRIEKTRTQAPGEARLIRHGPKNGEDLDEARLSEIVAEADQYFDAVCASPEGSVFTYHTSGFPRAKATAQIFINRLVERATQEPEHAIRFITEAERQAGDLNDSRYVVVDIEENEGLGFKNGTTEARAAFEEYKTLFGGDGIDAESFVAKLWIARGDEFAKFIRMAHAQIKKTNPGMSDADIDVALSALNPSRLNRTPEEHAIDELETIRDTMARLHTDHPDRPFYPTFVSHVPLIDFVALALMGKKLNLANYEEMGGISQYLESTNFKVNENGVVVFAEANGSGHATEIPIDTHIARLTAQADERRREWAQYFPR